MQEPIEVAVVIVNYRTAELTLRALAALAVESRRPELTLQVIVVENASGDEARLREGIAPYASFARLLVSPVNGGFGAGNNLGVRSLLGDGVRPRYVHFLNPDTVPREGAVLELVRFLEAHPRVGAAGSQFEDDDGTPWRMGFRFPSPLGELEGGACIGPISRLLDKHKTALPLGVEPVSVDWLAGASIMFRREVLEQLGGFDEAYFLYFEETDLCLRTKAAGWEIWYVPASKVMHIRGQSTGVTAINVKPKRLPRYWYESRRRYFVKNHGYGYAAVADLAYLAGNAIGSLRHALEGRPRPPRLLRDFVRESVLFAKNRGPVAPAQRGLELAGARGAR